MTRPGDSQEPWSLEDDLCLADMAGRVPLPEICEVLGRTRRAVEQRAYRLNLAGADITLRCVTPRLEWCPECARWRTFVPKTGRCRVCAKREQLQAGEDACSAEMALMDPEQRCTYAHTESVRGTRRLPPKPVKQPSCPISRYQRARAEARWLMDMEAWELKCLTRRIDATKKRLQRMREKTGRNPRKQI